MADDRSEHTEQLTVAAEKTVQESLIEALEQRDKKRRAKDLPIFYGDPKLDTLSATYFIDRVNTAGETANWDSSERAHHFRLALESHALRWFVVARDEKGQDWTTNFDQISEDFIEAFEPLATGTRTLTAVRDMKQKATENVLMFSLRVREAAFAWRRSSPMPSFTDTQEKRSYVKAGLRIAYNQMALAMFVLGLRDPSIQQKVFDKAPRELKDAIKQALDLEQAKEIRGEYRAESSTTMTGTKVAMVSQHQDQEEDETKTFEDEKEVDAVNQRQPYRRGGSRGNRRGQSRGGYQNQGQGRRETITCFHCGKPGHRQEACYTRIRNNAPLVDRNGVPLRSVAQVQNNGMNMTPTGQPPIPQGPPSEASFWAPSLANRHVNSIQTSDSLNLLQVW